MKLIDFTKSFTNIELVALVVFIIYIVFPFRTPSFLANSVNSPLGLLGVFLVSIYLFFYVNPVLGVVYIFVAYELLRRSAETIKSAPRIIQHSPTESKRKQEMVKMNPSVEKTLEEEVVQSMTEQHGSQNSYEISSNFKPVSQKVTGASLYK
jgi:hypothetical protein